MSMVRDIMPMHPDTCDPAAACPLPRGRAYLARGVKWRRSLSLCSVAIPAAGAHPL